MGGAYWLASYPKSGNTWFRIFLQNLRDDPAAPADINRLRIGTYPANRLWLDATLGFDSADLTASEIANLRPAAHEWEASRHDDVQYWTIHDAYGLTPDGRPLIGGNGILGAVYILRNPLDVCLSYSNYTGLAVDAIIDLMTDPAKAISRDGDGLMLRVQQSLLSWSAHVRSWTEAPGFNRLVIRYEDMVETPTETFTAAARFLDLPDDDARVAKAIRFSSFKTLQDQEQQSGYVGRLRGGGEAFFHRGRIGTWKGRLTDAHVRRLLDALGGTMARFGYRGDN